MLRSLFKTNYKLLIMKEIIYCEDTDKWVQCEIDEVVNDCEFEDDIDYLWEEFLKGPQYED